MRLVRIAPLAALVALACLAAPAGAALWKWTDANGRTVYSDTPPMGDVKAERVNGPPPPANANAAKEMVNQDADLKKRQAQREEDARKTDKSRTDETRRVELCTQARGQVQSLSGNPAVQFYRYNEKGERVLMDEAAKKRERERLVNLMKDQHCDA